MLSPQIEEFVRMVDYRITRIRESSIALTDEQTERIDQAYRDLITALFEPACEAEVSLSEYED